MVFNEYLGSDVLHVLIRFQYKFQKKKKSIPNKPIVSISFTGIGPALVVTLGLTLYRDVEVYDTVMHSANATVRRRRFRENVLTRATTTIKT